MLALAVPVNSLAQEDATLYEYQRRTKIVIHNILELVSPHLISNEAIIVKATEFRVTPTWLTNAYARRRPGGDRQVILGAGLSAYLEQIADAYVTEADGKAGCTNEYVAYLAPGLIDNTRRAARGLEPRGVALFYGFADSTHGACRGASPAIFQNVDNGRLFAGIMDASVAFVVLHELGHQVLGHVDHETNELTPRRSQEAEADAWAVSTALNSGYDLRAAAPWFILISAIGGDSIEDEEHSDHPLGGRRVLDSLKQSRQILLNRDPKAAKVLDATIRDLEARIPQ
jgi:hypothetical protein